MSRNAHSKSSLALVTVPGSEARPLCGRTVNTPAAEADGATERGGVTTAELKLPSCARQEDKSLVARAAGDIRAILARTVAHGMAEVGDYLLREFYDDNPALYRSASHAKHASIRLLEQRCGTMELPVRRTFLVNALQIAVLSRQLPKGAKFLELPPSHRVELLKLRVPEKVEQVAAKAVEANLSVQKVREIVRKDRERSRSSRGRRPTPAPLAALRLCVRSLRDPETGRLAFRKDEISGMDDEALAEAVELLEVLMKRAEEFVRLVS